MTSSEIIEARENKEKGLAYCSGKAKRKTYSKDTRKLIYLNTSGRCELCGKKILLDDMTIDHINPLSRGGRMMWEIYLAPVTHVIYSRGTFCSLT